MPWGNLFPRQVSSFGTDQTPSAVVAISQFNTCGTIVFIDNVPNDYYIYLNGTNPITPMWGGVNEVMTNPGGGVALSTAKPQQPWDDDRFSGQTTFGSGRVSSALAIVSNTTIPPALGFMGNGGKDIEYLYVVGGALCLGDETAWLSRSVAGQLVTIVGSGSRGTRVEGRTLFADDRNVAYPAAVVQSSGRGGAAVLASGDHKTAIAMYYDPTKAAGQQLVFDTAQNWLTWNAS